MIFVDIETTGLDPRRHDTVEIGAITLDGDRFNCTCRVYEGREISLEALKVNGRTMENLHDQSLPPPHVAYQEFVSWCLAHESKPLLAGWNLGSFDVQFLKYLAELYQFHWLFGYRYLDVQSMFFLKYNQSLSLDKAREILGLPAESKPHVAVNGAQACMEIYKSLTKEKSFFQKVRELFK